MKKIISGTIFLLLVPQLSQASEINHILDGLEEILFLFIVILIATLIFAIANFKSKSRSLNLWTVISSMLCLSCSFLLFQFYTLLGAVFLAVAGLGFFSAFNKALDKD